MGMDVFGSAPTSERGRYFRNNVWWWRPLWDYCCLVAPELTREVSGHTNDGDGLDAPQAATLADILRDQIAGGGCAEYASEHARQQAELDRTPCEWCEGTGIRRDRVGAAHGMPDRALDPEIAILLGRDTGWCNGCSGEGKVDDWRASYHFSVENVADFADFCAESGGFRIC